MAEFQMAAKELQTDVGELEEMIAHRIRPLESAFLINIDLLIYFSLISKIKKPAIALNFRCARLR